MESKKKDGALVTTEKMNASLVPVETFHAPATNADAEKSRAEATKAETLLALAELLPSLSRGDKTFIKQAARAVFGIEPPHRRRSSGGNPESKVFGGDKSLSQSLAFYFPTQSFITSEVNEKLLKAGVITKGKAKGYILNKSYGRTLKPNSEARPLFTGEGALRAFKEIELL